MCVQIFRYKMVVVILPSNAYVHTSIVHVVGQTLLPSDTTKS